MRSSDLLVLGAVVLGLLIVGHRTKAAPPEAPPERRPSGIPPDAPLPPIPEDDFDEPTRNRAVSRLDQLLEELFATDPTGGSFYQVQDGDTPESIARAVLGSVGAYTERNVLDYVYCFSSSSWNLDLYGSPSTSRRYPRRYIVPGFGQGVRAAFLPRNADALALLGSGQLPHRTVDLKTGARTDADAAHHGVLWLPPVSPEQLRLGVVTCAPFSWPDGSSTINPHPELLELLEAA